MSRSATLRVLVSSLYWDERELDYWKDDGLVVRPRARLTGPVPRVVGRVFYIWRPDFEKLWPGQREDETVAQPVRRRKPGPQPTANWKSRVTYHVGYIKGSGKNIPTAVKIAEWCVETLRYHPDISDIQKLLKTRLD
jgi:hypothetical protein